MTKEQFFDRSYPEPNTGCFIWSGSVDRDGYGRVYPKTNYGFLRAHRLSFFLENGTDPKEETVMHTCDNRWCVNPMHLCLGTSQTNTADRHAKKRDAKGSNHGMSKLTEEDALKILTLYATNKYGRSKLQRLFNVSSNAIYGIISGRTWRHVVFDRKIIDEVHTKRRSNWKPNNSLR